MDGNGKQLELNTYMLAPAPVFSARHQPLEVPYGDSEFDRDHKVALQGFDYPTNLMETPAS